MSSASSSLRRSTWSGSPSSAAISARSAASSSGFGRFSAIRRDSELRTVRLSARLAGDPVTEYPARCQATDSMLATLRLARSGSSRSSRNRSTNSSRERAKRKSSSPSPSGLPSEPPPPSPPRGVGSCPRLHTLCFREADGRATRRSSCDGNAVRGHLAPEGQPRRRRQRL